MDQVRTTTEDVLPALDARGGTAAGVLVRERESTRDSTVPDNRNDGRSPRGSSMQRDADYQVGRRVEQVVSQPGTLRRLHVVAVVRQSLSADQQEQLRQLVGAAVGASVERGDTVLVQAFEVALPGRPALDVEPVKAPMANGGDMGGAGAWIAVVAAAAALLVAALFLSRRRPGRALHIRPLSEPQRQVALGQVRAWLQGDEGRLSEAVVSRREP
jgi:flagellar M-ring protein FliF